MKDTVLHAFALGSLSAPEVQEVTGLPRLSVDDCIAELLELRALEVVRTFEPVRYAQFQPSSWILKHLRHGRLSVPEIMELTHLDRTEVEETLQLLLESEAVIEATTKPLVRYGLRVDPNEPPEPIPPQEPAVVVWCKEQIEASMAGTASVRLAELVNRRGVHTANKRLRTNALRETCKFLYSAGIQTSPDYREASQSPGVDAVTLISLIPNTSDKPSQSVPKALDSDSMEHYLDLAMALAHADGATPDVELTAIKDRAESRMQILTEDEQTKLRASMAELRHRDFDLDIVIEQLKESLSLHERRSLLEELFDVAMADGVFHEQEEQFLRKLHTAFGTTLEHFNGLIGSSELVVCRGPQTVSPSMGIHIVPDTEPQEDVIPTAEEHREINRLFSLLTGQ